MKRLGALLVFCSLAAAVPATAAELPVIGQDDQGMPVEVLLPRQEYSRRLTRLIEATQESALPALGAARQRNGWMLRTVMVGVGVSLTLGVGPIVQLNATPRFRLAFSNSNDPAYP